MTVGREGGGREGGEVGEHHECPRGTSLQLLQSGLGQGGSEVSAWESQES